MKWEDEKYTIQNMINDEMSVQQVADHYNTSRQRMYQIMTKYNISTPQARQDSFMLNRPPEDYWLMKTLCTKTTDKELRMVLFEELTPVPYMCPVLDIPLDFSSKTLRSRSDYSPSLDRIDSDKGYEPGNCAIISWRANRIKNNGTATEHKLIWEWMENNQ